MKKISSLLVACFMIVQAYAQQLPAAYNARLQATLDSVCSAYGLKGASAAVMVPGIGTWTGVWGDSYSGQPITSDMLFSIGSNTKTFVSSLMLKMQEEGMLDVDDTIGTWIQNQPNINGAITIRQMLNHTSGIASYTDNPSFFDSINADYNRVWLPQELLPFISSPSFQPGQGFEYSNSNYLLAGIIISEVAGQPFEVVLRDKILQPQGLANTFYYPQEPIAGTMPHAWYWNGSNEMMDLAALGIPLTSIFSAASTAGAIVSTAEDNAKFWHLLISGQLINAASLGEMRQFDVTLNGGRKYGLGIMRYASFDGHVAYEHGGTNIGFINENLADSVTGVTISVLTNQDSISNDQLLNGVVKALHKVTINAPTAIDNIAAAPVWELWPNPAHRLINIAGAAGAAYSIFDMAGRKRMGGSVRTMHYSIDVSGLTAGLYIVHIGNSARTLVVE